MRGSRPSPNGVKTRYVRKAEMATLTATCPICGATIRPRTTPRGYRFIAGYCSKRCSRLAAGSLPTVPATCEVCGKTYQRPQWVPNRKYCSRRCTFLGLRKSTWTVKKNGYLIFWTGKAEVGVHRIVMEKRLGRPLFPSETVHHINGQRDDNRDENLELWDHGQPHGQRVAEKMAWCIEFLSRHLPR